LKTEKTRMLSAIDVGTSKVAALIAELSDKGGLRLTGVGSVPCEGMKKGVVTDIDRVTQSIYQALNAAEKMAGRVVVSATVGISGSHVGINEARGMTNVDNPDRGITRADVIRAMEASKQLTVPPDKQIIDIIRQDCTVDGQSGVRDPEGMCGGRLEVDVRIVTGATMFVQNLLKCVTKLNVEVESFVMTPVAAAEAVLNEDEKEIGTILIDFGAGTTSVAVYKKNQLGNARIFPVGSRHIDNDIAIVLGTSPREAERLKCEYGIAFVDERVGGDPVEIELVGGEKKSQITRGMLCEIIHERVVEIVKMVGYDLETDLPMTVVPAGIVITGGGARLVGLAHVVEQILGMNVRVARPIYMGDHAEEVAEPEFAAAMGMLKYAARAGSHHSTPEHGGFPARNLFRTAAQFLKALFK
jgi:cell division protein FtsA